MTTLPSLPVKWFGLGQVSDKLVAIGGVKEKEDKVTKDVYTYDERSQKWKKKIPPMLTARRAQGVLSLQSAPACIRSGRWIHIWRLCTHS